MAVAMREQPQDVELFVTLTERECTSPALNTEDDDGRLNDSMASTPKQSHGADGVEECSTELGADAVVDPEDPLEASLQRALETRCFVGCNGMTTSYLYTTQLTHSNVVSTVVTSRPFSLKRRQNSLLAINSNNASEPSKPSGGLPQDKKKPVSGSRNQGDLHATHVYGQPCNPKKVRNQQKGKYQAQLPAFRRSLPSLPIPVNRLNQELIQVGPYIPNCIG